MENVLKPPCFPYVVSLPLLAMPRSGPIHPSKDDCLRDHIFYVTFPLLPHTLYIPLLEHISYYFAIIF